MNESGKNKLTILKEIEPRISFVKGVQRKRRMAIFLCECGTEKVADISDVKCGHTTRCNKCSLIAKGNVKRTHGQSKHPLYRKWQDMKNRCYNQKVNAFKHYGGRGIEVCDEWKKDYHAFYLWCIDNGWVKGLEVDRLDVNGNYSKENCRITTHIENGYNKRNTRYVVYQGKTICLAKLLNDMGLSQYYYKVHHSHVRKNKPLEDIMKKIITLKINTLQNN